MARKRKPAGNIVLTGFMGTGKTEVGRILADRLGFCLIDVDAEIVKSRGMAVADIFRLSGEESFRDAESHVIREVAARRNAVISTGGGAVLRPENVDALRSSGIIVCLTASPETIYERTSRTTDRPLLQVDDPLRRIRQLLEQRRPFYETADIVIDTENKTPADVAEEILHRMDVMSSLHRSTGKAGCMRRNP